MDKSSKRADLKGPSLFALPSFPVASQNTTATGDAIATILGQEVTVKRETPARMAEQEESGSLKTLEQLRY